MCPISSRISIPNRIRLTHLLCWNLECLFKSSDDLGSLSLDSLETAFSVLLIIIPRWTTRSRIYREKTLILWQVRTLASSQNTESENQVSSTTTSWPVGFRLYRTAAVDDVTTTRLTDATLLHDVRTLTVPLTAGSITSAFISKSNKQQSY